MKDLAKILAKNIHSGSGNHGLSEEELYNLFKNCNKLEQFAYTLRKCVEFSQANSFITQEIIIDQPNIDKFTQWHHIDEPWNESWGFEKTHPGCYLYAVFENGPPPKRAKFLDEAVIYIGESRAITRNSMLGRRTDFKGTVRNNRLSPYGCGTVFKESIGQEKIDHCYQAYLPLHPSLCKKTELEILTNYYLHFRKIPICNPALDLARVKRYLESILKPL